MEATISILEENMVIFTFSQPLITPVDITMIDFSKIFSIKLISALDQ